MSNGGRHSSSKIDIAIWLAARDLSFWRQEPLQCSIFDMTTLFYCFPTFMIDFRQTQNVMIFDDG